MRDSHRNRFLVSSLKTTSRLCFCDFNILFGWSLTHLYWERAPNQYDLSLNVSWCTVCTYIYGRFLSGGIILGSPLSCTDLFLYTITLPAVSCDAPPTLSYTTLELVSRVLLSSKKPASRVLYIYLLPTYCTLCTVLYLEAGFLDDKSTLDSNSRVV
jgi:hypothetical protein